MLIGLPPRILFSEDIARLHNYAEEGCEVLKEMYQTDTINRKKYLELLDLIKNRHIHELADILNEDFTESSVLDKEDEEMYKKYSTYKKRGKFFF